MRSFVSLVLDFPTQPHKVGTHLAACVLQQIDPLALSETGGADPDAAGDDRYTERGSSRQGTANSEASRMPGRTSSPAEALAQAAPLPMFNKPRCVSGRLPGGLWYVRALLPPTAESPKRRGGKGGGGDGGGSDGEGDAESDTEEGHRGGGSDDAAKSFTTGAIVVGGCGKGGEEKRDAADGDVGVTGDYCLVRVDSLDRVCDVIYCGRGAVEAKNLSKVVGVQLGYLQASREMVKHHPAVRPTAYCSSLDFSTVGCVRRRASMRHIFTSLLYFISSVPAPFRGTHSPNTSQGLETAFERGEVSSWIDFFRRGALTPLYHDRFPKLSEELREALANGDEAAANLLSALNKVGCVPSAQTNRPKPHRHVHGRPRTDVDLHGRIWTCLWTYLWTFVDLREPSV